MRRRLMIGLIAATLGVGLVGCPPSGPRQPAELPRPGEPVSHPTLHYLDVNGQRQYFRTEEDLRLALWRLANSPPATTAPQ